MFLLLLALLIGLVLGQFIKIEIPNEAQQELIGAIKSIPGTAKVVFQSLVQGIQQQRQSIDSESIVLADQQPLAGSVGLLDEPLQNQAPIKAATEAD